MGRGLTRVVLLRERTDGTRVCRAQRLPEACGLPGTRSDMAVLRVTNETAVEAPAGVRSRSVGWLDARLDELRRREIAPEDREVRCRRFLAVVLVHRMKQLARSSQIHTENGVDAFMKEHQGPGSMALRRWFDFEALSFATIAGAFNSLGMTVADMGGLLAATLVGADTPPYVKGKDKRHFRMELRAEDLRQLDALLGHFERALGTDEEAAFVRGLTDESTVALREAIESEAPNRAAQATETSAIWESVGFFTVLAMTLYEAVLVWLRVPTAVLGYTVLPLCFVLILLVSGRLGERQPENETLERLRQWADPKRNARVWMATYRWMVPGLAGIVGMTILTILFRR